MFLFKHFHPWVVLYLMVWWVKGWVNWAAHLERRLWVEVDPINHTCTQILYNMTFEYIKIFLFIASVGFCIFKISTGFAVQFGATGGGEIKHFIFYIFSLVLQIISDNWGPSQSESWTKSVTTPGEWERLYLWFVSSQSLEEAVCINLYEGSHGNVLINLHQQIPECTHTQTQLLKIYLLRYILVKQTTLLYIINI